MYLTVRVEQCHSECGIPEYNVSQMTYDYYGTLYITIFMRYMYQ